MGTMVAIAGASGYAGGELLRLLLDHPAVEIGPLAAGAAAGEPVTALHPHLPQLAGADVVFLALPHGESGPLAAALLARGVTVVDLGADHRLAAEAWQAWYDSPSAGTWTYGLPELPGTRAALAGTDRVAVPGCYPTAVTLALAPLLAAGLVAREDVVVVAASGTSGAGRSAAPKPAGLSAYDVARHRHTPEIEQALGLASPVSFTTVLAPMPRGILATCTAPLAGSAAHLRRALHAAYDEEPFVHVLPEGGWPTTAAVTGSNSCHLQVAADERAGRAVAVAAIDNLGKGAAGQAVQCANLLLGLPEVTGLPTRGICP